MTTIKIINRETGEIVKSFDVTDKSIRQQEALFDSLLRKTDLDRFDVFMVTPEDGTAVESPGGKYESS